MFLQLKEDLEKTAKKVEDYKPYNILPFEAPGVVNPFENSLEVGPGTRVIVLIGVGLFTSSFALPSFSIFFWKINTFRSFRL